MNAGTPSLTTQSKVAFTMAQLWRVYEGREPTRETSRWHVLSLADCIVNLSLTKAHFLKAYPPEGVTPIGPTFGDVDHLTGYKDPTILIVEIEDTEAHANGWRAGFYRAPMPLAEAEQLLTKT